MICAMKPKPAIAESDPIFEVARRLLELEHGDGAARAAAIGDLRRMLNRAQRAPQGWVCLKEAAHRAGVSTETVRRWCHQGHVVAGRFNGSWWLDPRTLPRRTAA
jgi:hypothetical protein